MSAGEQEIYEKLRQKVNNTEFRAPRSPSFIKVLKYYFPTVEDAEIALCLEVAFRGAGPKTAEDVAKELGKYHEEVEDTLKRLAARGGVVILDRPAEMTGYTLMTSWTMSDLLGTMGLDDSPGTVEYRRRVNALYEESLLMEWGPSKYPLFRTLVVDKPIEAGTKVLPFETAADVIKANDTIALGWCNCRIRMRKCDRRTDNCFHFGPAGDFIVRSSEIIEGARPVKYVSTDRALEVLEESFKEGLVASTMSNSDPLQAMFICMCCPCCCHIVGGYARNITGWGNPYQMLKSNFRPKTDREQCKLCLNCVEICAVNALWHHWPHREDLSDDYVFLEEERCIGCGICAHNCPAGAIEMERVRDVILEPNIAAQWERVVREGRHE